MLAMSGQVRNVLLALPANHLEQHFRISDNGNCDGHERKPGKLNDAAAIHKTTGSRSVAFSHSRQ